MKIVTVVPLKKGAWKEDLTYFTAQDIANGSVVTVPLRNKKVLGLVIDVEDVRGVKSNIKDMSFNLKKITEVKKHSFFLKEYLESAVLTSRYFVSNKNNGIVSLIPAVFRENYDKLNSKDGPWGNSLKDRPYLKSEKLIFQAPREERFSSYKTLIRGAFAQKKSVFIVMPTEHDIKIFSESLSHGIEQFTFCVHSGISAKKILAVTEKIMTSVHPVLIIGTVPFLSIPRRDIETIILEHESSNAYKTIGRPYFDLRIFAEIYASKINAKFIMADQLLRFETIGRKDLDNLNPLHPMSFRTNFSGTTEIFGKKSGDGFKIFTDESITEMQNVIAKKENIFIFTLRKGLATMTVCRDCGDTISCPKCGAPLVLHLSHQGKRRMFVCNKCVEDRDGDTACASCGSWNLMPLGIGIDTVGEEIEKLFPKTKIFKLDKENAKSRKGAEEIMKKFEANPGSILIGTEMALFYFKEKVKLSVVASFDSLWSVPNFKMGERIIQITLSIINATSKKLIIQTKNKDDAALTAIQAENLLSFVREELEDRRKLDYPPFVRFIKITHLGDREQTTRARKILEEIFSEYHPEIFSGFVARFKDKYVTNALIKMDLKKWSLPEISLGSHIDEDLLAKLLTLPPQFEIFVDPEDLL
ncbi:hypothetical protein HY311_02125 [Candidatus Nomurabacteria bacterium]|nr:hypothetical protein [Candidatus Nomurabacteria bacterium]